MTSLEDLRELDLFEHMFTACNVQVVGDNTCLLIGKQEVAMRKSSLRCKKKDLSLIGKTRITVRHSRCKSCNGSSKNIEIYMLNLAKTTS